MHDNDLKIHEIVYGNYQKYTRQTYNPKSHGLSHLSHIVQSFEESQ